ncbi:hypothetical protein [uncultured Jatrophihabitans sp.]|uniref:hypothetical protein n=1 Tax=uncultured Jatrophihabitans sp. TaxID=1610747 RepID=UPI0035CB2B4A
MGSYEDVDRVTPPTEAGPLAAGVLESGAVESGAVESGAVESGAVESGAVESGAVGASASGVVEPQSVDAELAALSDLPLSEHAVVFERLHTRLQSALSAIDA